MSSFVALKARVGLLVEIFKDSKDYEAIFVDFD